MSNFFQQQTSLNIKKNNKKTFLGIPPETTCQDYESYQTRKQEGRNYKETNEQMQYILQEQNTSKYTEALLIDQFKRNKNVYLCII